MTRKPFHKLIFAFILLFSFGLTVACNQTPEPTTQTGCYSIEHFAGITCVPDEFERVVALDSVSFENAVSLGVTPVGAVLTDLSTHLQEKQEGVANIGTTGEPNLESVLALNPDLILGLDFNERIYEQASQIAPTVLLEFEHSGKWKEVFEKYGVVLSREAKAQEVLANYNQRLEEFQNRLSALDSPPPQVSVVRIYPDSINLYLRDSFPGTILQDARLSRPPSQNLSAEEAQQVANNPIQMSISKELLKDIDGDALFLWTAEDTPQAQEKAQQELAKLQADSLWQKLKVVQENKVYQVPTYWIGWGPIAAELVIDDLFNYLLND